VYNVVAINPIIIINNMSAFETLYVKDGFIYFANKVTSSYVLLRDGRGGSQAENEVHPQ